MMMLGKKYLKYALVLACSLYCMIVSAQAQEQPTFITPALTTLNISPDAKSSGMGDVGAASSPSINSQHWNAAKYPFMQDNSGVGLSYVPWLREVANDVNLIYLAGFTQFGQRQSLSASVYFFSLGDINLYGDNAQYINNIKPRDYAVDLAYARKFGEKIAGSLTFRYINTTIIEMNVNTPYIAHKGALAADVGVYWTSGVNIFNRSESNLSFGACVSNVGTKLKTSSNNEYFLPMNLRIGGQLSTSLNEVSTLALAADVNKLLVPESMEYANEAVPAALFHSFSDGGSSYSVNVGLEYLYDNRLAVRTGYYTDSRRAGARQYVTLGASIRYNLIAFDISYLATVKNQSGILANTLRFTLSLAFGNAL